MMDMQSNSQSVSELNQKIKTIVETTFLHISVEGEVSNLNRHNSGHYYFSIKDEESAIKCVLFRGNVSSGLKFELKNTQRVQITGGISVYTPRGEYQIICNKIVLSGQGAQEFERLKAKLEAKGYFNAANKKALPKFPKKIALITSNTGAALQDMLRVAQSRWPYVKMVNYDTLVQGVEASKDIAKNIKAADSYFGSDEAFDIIVVARGGGSTEDLWAFNEEIVADAIFEAKTPIVSAIGHEIDYVISDFVADSRAPTPSAAMEIILPDSTSWLLTLDEFYENLDFMLKSFLETQERKLNDLSFMLSSLNLDLKIATKENDILDLKMILNQKFDWFLESKKLDDFFTKLEMLEEQLIRDKENMWQAVSSALQGNNFTELCKNGYAQILFQGQPRAIDQLNPEDSIEIVGIKTLLKAVVQEKQELPDF